MYPDYAMRQRMNKQKSQRLAPLGTNLNHHRKRLAAIRIVTIAIIAWLLLTNQPTQAPGHSLCIDQGQPISCSLLKG